MKSFVISLIIFSAMIGAITLNCTYVSRFSKRLSEITEELPSDRLPDDNKTARKLDAFWKEHEFFIMLTNDHTRIHEIYGSIQELNAAILSKNFTVYTASRMAIEEAIKSFREFDTFSLEGIL